MSLILIALILKVKTIVELENLENIVVLLSVSTRNKTLISVNFLIKCIKGYCIGSKKEKQTYQMAINNSIQ